MPELAYVNGVFCDPGSARVSIEDRGFQFADSVYEVVAAFGGRPFRLGEHMDRLRSSLEGIDMVLDLDALGLEEMIRRGIERCGYDPAMAYLQITRGVQARAHIYKADLEPTVAATFKPKPPIEPSEREAGCRVMTVTDFRWSWCEIKSTALLPNVLAKNRARRDGYDDAIFVAPSGEVREATSANVFALIDGTLVTPTLQASILHGVTRGYVLECADRLEIPTRQGPLTTVQLQSADEAFLSSTAVDIMPIARVNDQPVGAGRMGPVTRSLCQAFFDGLASG